MCLCMWGKHMHHDSLCALRGRRGGGAATETSCLILSGQRRRSGGLIARCSVQSNDTVSDDSCRNQHLGRTECSPSLRCGSSCNRRGYTSYLDYSMIASRSARFAATAPRCTCPARKSRCAPAVAPCEHDMQTAASHNGFPFTCTVFRPLGRPCGLAGFS